MKKTLFILLSLLLPAYACAEIKVCMLGASNAEWAHLTPGPFFDSCGENLTADWTKENVTLTYSSLRYRAAASAGGRFYQTINVDTKYAYVVRAKIIDGTASGIRVRWFFDDGVVVQYSDAQLTNTPTSPAIFRSLTGMFRPGKTGTARLGIEVVDDTAGNYILFAQLSAGEKVVPKGIDLRVVAIAGSASTHWIEGGAYYDDAVFQQADIYVQMIGCNDFGALFNATTYPDFWRSISGYIVSGLTTLRTATNAEIYYLHEFTWRQNFAAYDALVGGGQPSDYWGWYGGRVDGPAITSCSTAMECFFNRNPLTRLQFAHVKPLLEAEGISVVDLYAETVKIFGEDDVDALFTTFPGGDADRMVHPPTELVYGLLIFPVLQKIVGNKKTTLKGGAQLIGGARIK